MSLLDLIMITLVIIDPKMALVAVLLRIMVGPVRVLSFALAGLPAR
jgi:hypothetical protein